MSSSLDASVRAFRMLKFFGLAPITINENLKSVTKPFDVFMSLFNLLLGALICSVLITNYDELLKQREIVDYADYFVFMASTTLSMSQILFASIFRHQIWDLIMILYEIELELEKLNCKLPFGRINYLFLMLGVAMMSMLIPLIGMNYYLEKSFVKLMMFPYSSMLLCSSQFFVVRFNTGVIIMLIGLKQVCCNIKTVDSPMKRHALFQKLNHIYDRTLHLNDKCIKLFSFQAMLGIGLIWAYTIFMAFSVYKDVITKAQISGKTITSIAFCIYYNIASTTLIVSCSAMKVLVSFCAQVIFELLKELLKDFTDPENSSQQS